MQRRFILILDGKIESCCVCLQRALRWGPARWGLARWGHAQLRATAERIDRPFVSIVPEVLKLTCLVMRAVLTGILTLRSNLQRMVFQRFWWFTSFEPRTSLSYVYPSTFFFFALGRFLDICCSYFLFVTYLFFS